MIRNYKENNGFGCDAQHGRNNKVALYAQQMFYHLMRKFKEDKGKKFIIKSEYALLHEPLQVELLSFKSEKTIVSPFLSSLINAGDIRFKEQYVWVLQREQLESLPEGHGAYSDQYAYESPVSGAVKFIFEFQRQVSGQSCAAFGLRIKSLPPSKQSIEFRYSAIIDDVV